MKCYIIRETAGYPTIVRDGKVITIALGEQFSEDELSSLTCETSVTYICTEDNLITTQEPGAKVVAPVAQKAPATPATPATPVKEAEAPETD